MSDALVTSISRSAACATDPPDGVERVTGGQEPEESRCVAAQRDPADGRAVVEEDRVRLDVRDDPTDADRLSVMLGQGRDVDVGRSRRAGRQPAFASRAA